MLGLLAMQLKQFPGRFRARTSVVAVAALFSLACGTAPQPSADADSSQPPLHLYLLIGQSNMAGRGTVEAIDSQPHPRVFALKLNHEWGPASEPLHWDKPERIGVGPGFAFGRAMADQNPSVRIGLIPAAVGGSSIRAWLAGAVHEQTNSHPWDDMVARTNHVLAQQGGDLKGAIWHQGESDSGDYTDQYEAALVDLVQRLRKEFNKPNLPFVAAQLAPYYTETHPGALKINEIVSRLPELVSNTAYVTAEGLNHLGDGTHLDSASEREIGKRYADAMAKLDSN
jgi:hypothetical protein